ncbi:putative peptidase (DUF1758) domain-containing protein [Phthorimaea operculella]|nr:putative peptidase (DUF1758) domain-containing protein [Phthorimaea operculella]
MSKTAEEAAKTAAAHADAEKMAAEIDRKLSFYEMQSSAFFARMQTVFDSIPASSADQVTIDSFLAMCVTIDYLRSEYISCIQKKNDLESRVRPNYVFNFQTIFAFDDLYNRVKFECNRLQSIKPQQGCQPKNLFSRTQAPKNLKSRTVGNPEPQEQAESKPIVSPETSQSYVNLPRLELVSFDGDIQKWPLFYESFRSVIHENKRLTNTEKMQYLVGKLSGNALNMCRGIMPTGDNYLTLWNALINKYQDTRALATAYIDQLLKLKKVVNATPATLDEFADKYATTIAALKQLKINDLEEFMFLHLGLKCLDTETARAFEMYKRDEDFPNSDDLTQFIREQSRILSRASLGNTSHSAPPARAPRNIPTQGSQSFARPASNSQQPKAFKTFLSVQNATDNDANKNLCPYCQSSAHNLYACPLFTPLSPRDRRNSHGVPIPKDNQVSLCVTNKQLEVFSLSRTVLLGTAVCQALGPDSQNSIPVRIVVDSASMRNIMTEECRSRLNLPLYPSHGAKVSGLGGNETETKGVTSVILVSRFDENERYDVHPFVVDCITEELPCAPIDISELSYLHDLPLADDSYHAPGSIDMIVGSDFFARILKSRKFSGSRSEPVGIETSFGYLVVGNAPTATEVIEPEFATSFPYPFPFPPHSLQALKKKKGRYQASWPPSRENMDNF